MIIVSTFKMRTEIEPKKIHIGTVVSAFNTRILTKISALHYALQKFDEHNGGKIRMITKIRTKEVCPKCNQKFTHIKKVGFICTLCETRPLKFFIDLWWQKKRYKIYSDEKGQPLDSYQRALNLLFHINHEIDNHTFDPSRYIKAEQTRFYFSNFSKVWIDEKLREVEQGLKAFSYVRELIAYRDKYFIPFFGTRDIREIRRYDIDEFKARLPEHLSPKTIKNILNALKNFFYTAYNKEIIKEISSFPTIHVPEFSDWKWIDAETQIKIIDAIPDPHKPIFIFLFLHGCRPGEARALKIKDINFITKTIKIRRTFSLNQLRETTKQKKQNTIPVHPEFMPYLIHIAKSSLPEAFVFTHYRTGRPYNGETLRKIWRRALKATQLEKTGLRLYDASRHSFASQLINVGIPLNIVSKLLGHSSIKMTQRYAHENLNTMKLALKKLSLSSKITVPRLSPEAKKV